MKYHHAYMLASFLGSIMSTCGVAQNDNPKNNNPFTVIAYYTGDSASISNYRINQLTHIIYSFGHLDGDTITIDPKKGPGTLRALAALKRTFPQLKIQIALGGWGGCRTCSEVFSTSKGRENFALSVRRLCIRYGIDGIDVDWEYPAIEGYPGHPFKLEDRENLTALLQELRMQLGAQAEISFAVGAFARFVNTSAEWRKIEPLIDRVNLMNYDFVSEGSKITGHHTPLYSSAQTENSADHAINLLRSAGFPLNKIVIGCAFYSRSFEQVGDQDHGLYQPGKFFKFIPYRNLEELSRSDSSMHLYRDETTHSPFLYSRSNKIYYSFDDPISVSEKTQYALDKRLNGVMFWELTLDKQTGGLLDAISKVMIGSDVRKK
jgi:chitinase